MMGATGLLIAAACAALIGFASQRGGVCMVAAVDEVVSRGRADRLLALGEAAAWVAVGLVVASRVGFSLSMPAGYSATFLSVAGGALLGIGALLNGACAVGAIARLGRGEWAYALTPLGFLAGCALAGPLLARFAPTPAPGTSLLFALPLWLLAPVGLFLAWRLGRLAVAARRRRDVSGGWSPHLATTVIGIAFVVMVLAAGGWAYTALLGQLARGMSMNLPAQLLLFAALAAGAVAGGWRGGTLRRMRPPIRLLVRCLVGGGLMGAGSLLAPGGNDGLVLMGLPLLQAHAWLAILSMVVVVAAGLWLSRAIAPPAAAVAG
jgi:toxin CptA